MRFITYLHCTCVRIRLSKVSTHLIKKGEGGGIVKTTPNNNKAASMTSKQADRTSRRGSPASLASVAWFGCLPNPWFP